MANTMGQSGQYPVANAEYDLITILAHKLKGIEAYQIYLKDTKGDQELAKLIQECLQQDQQMATRLHDHLHRIHEGGGQQSRAAGR